MENIKEVVQSLLESDFSEIRIKKDDSFPETKVEIWNGGVYVGRYIYSEGESPVSISYSLEDDEILDVLNGCDVPGLLFAGFTFKDGDRVIEISSSNELVGRNKDIVKNVVREFGETCFFEYEY